MKQIFSTGIIATPLQPNIWQARVEYFTAFHGSIHSVQGVITPQYTGELSKSIDLAIDSLNALGIQYMGEPALYVQGDGEDFSIELPVDWKAQFEKECKRLGFRFIYGEPEKFSDEASIPKNDWQLYRSKSAESIEASADLDKALARASKAKTLDQGWRILHASLAEHSALGATDTAVREIAESLLEERFFQKSVNAARNSAHALPSQSIEDFAARNGWTQEHLIHARDNQGNEYESETSVVLANGREILSDLDVSYARVVQRDSSTGKLYELGFWNSDEWQEDPSVVMGAILGCATVTSDEEGETPKQRVDGQVG